MPMCACDSKHNNSNLFVIGYQSSLSARRLSLKIFYFRVGFETANDGRKSQFSHARTFPYLYSVRKSNLVRDRIHLKILFKKEIISGSLRFWSINESISNNDNYNIYDTLKLFISIFVLLL